MNRDHTPPHIDYTVRDYAGFRRQLLDHLAVLAPGWTERGEADLGVALVDILAYVADYTSYYQDAVATEAYLGTARLRRSVRRHARLLDFNLHDGCNARVWVVVALNTSDEPVILPRGTQIFAGGEGIRPPRVLSIGGVDHQELLGQGAAVVFETMHQVTLIPAQNRMLFGGPKATDGLPRGATNAYLQGRLDELKLERGDVLIFEEVLGPASGRAEDADPARRHAVRLTRVESDDKLTAIAWHAEDALPFDLVTSRAFGGTTLIPVSVARGNVVLADHGRTILAEELPPISAGVRYRPRLRLAGLIQAELYDHPQARAGRPASATLVQRPEVALPAIDLVEIAPEPLRLAEGAVPLVPIREHPAGSRQLYPAKPWTLRGDLLSSGVFIREYLVETEDDGAAYLRFGFAEAGWQPSTIGARMLATYRVGGGPDGNVGVEALVAIAVEASQVQSVAGVRNPLAAAGGCLPVRVEAARLHAPQAYRTWKPPEHDNGRDYPPPAFEAQERCVTLEDYAAVATRHPAVAQAIARACWTGSRQMIVVFVSRRDGAAVDRRFCDELCGFLEPYRTAGHAIDVAPPRYVSVDLGVRIHVRDGQARGRAKAAVLEALCGPAGFFAPTAFGFGETVHRSRLVARLAALPGVGWVDVPRFGRACAQGSVEHLVVGPLEIARLDPATLAAATNAISIEVGR
jgi:hypothetical protein